MSAARLVARPTSGLLATVARRTVAFRGSLSQSAHRSYASNGLTSQTARIRPTLRPSTNAVVTGLTGLRAARTIFIQTEPTPNVDALKFKPNHRILPAEITTPFIEYLNPRSTIAPPYPSPLAAELMNIEGVTAVFYGADFITVTKDAEANWAHIKPEIFSHITEAITSGAQIVTLGKGDGQGEQGVASDDSLAYNESDSETVGMIKELLETRIRPAIQEDGGDIEFRGFSDKGIVLLKLRGACRTCDSSTVTLKNGIEGMLMHYIEEVQGVEQVTDPEEEIALAEFEKFEEKLRQQKGAEAVAN